MMMFKRFFNEFTLVFDLSPYEAPLLIKSGHESGADPTLLDMNFVRTTHPRTGKMTVFLPGSSLKGTLRSYCEKIARTVRPSGGSNWCCDPFELDSGSPNVFCGKRLERKKSTADIYNGSCVACRIFGNTGMASHLTISDAYPLDDPQPEQRDGVAIHRVFGTVAAGPFNLEVITRGTFRAKITLQNYQLWQIGLLAIVFRDLGQGLVPIGFGKSKGFGKMKIAYNQLEVSYPGQFSPKSNGHDLCSELVDINAFSFPEHAKYGLAPADPAFLPLTEKGYEVAEDGTLGRISVRCTDAAGIEATLKTTVGHWKACALGIWPPSEGHDE